MEIKEVVLPSINKFASDYMKNLFSVKDFFHYDLKEVNVFGKRYEDLMQRSFNRKDLALTIENYMKHFGLSTEVKANLERLQQEDAVIVIGGQQAGLLTGPLYTIHKVISIIKVAKEQEILLGKPVIPVFWIAGEDHDLEEVNHVYIEQNQVFKKVKYPSSTISKAMITDVQLDKPTIEKWLKEIFSSFEETAYTKDLYNTLLGYSSKSPSFTHFFSCIINELFQKYGLLLIDSADISFRKMQSSFFETLIQQQQSINQAVKQQQEYITQQGYKPIISMDEKNANLFYYENEERVLLEYDEEQDLFQGKNHSLQLTKEQLLEIARNEPEKLSNNVVTRPLMQEYLFPVQAFISGPGEIAYWSELKKAFEQVGMQMCPIIPRMNITLLEKKVQKDLEDVNMDIYEALVQGAEKAKKRFLNSIEDEEISSLFEKLESQFKKNHFLLSQAAKTIDKGLEPIFNKNSDLIQGQLQYLRNKIQQSINSKHSHELAKYNRITNALRPNDGPQERTTNIYYFLNQYGPEFMSELMDLPFESNSFHKVVVL